MLLTSSTMPYMARYYSRVLLTFFRWQRILLLRLSLLQLGLVKAGDLLQIRFVRHDCCVPK